ncbi:MAG: FliH/SctL family protein [Demequina sp.]|uniref:FliH/SctL family protein n=1 Tax=Demequina sp. TaxID=2050685 RepID=UPI003A85B166
MSPDTVAPFVPATLGRGAAQASTASQAAGYAAGWTAGAKAAAEAARQQAEAHERDHARREQMRDERIGAAVTALAAATLQWRERALPVVASAERLLEKAGVDLAEAILTRELTPGPETARDALARALAVPGDVAPSSVKVAPTDYAEISRLVDDGVLRLPDGVDLEADAALSPGDCVTVHETGTIDATVRAALARARQALEDS